MCVPCTKAVSLSHQPGLVSSVGPFAACRPFSLSQVSCYSSPVLSKIRPKIIFKKKPNSHTPRFICCWFCIMFWVFSPAGQSTLFSIKFPDSGKEKGVNTGSDSGWDLIPGQYGHVCGSRVNQWTSSGQREDQQDYADGACEGQTFRLQTYLSVINVPCKSLAKKVVYFCDPEIFCRLKRDRILIKSSLLVQFWWQWTRCKYKTTFSKYYCDNEPKILFLPFQFILW